MQYRPAAKKKYMGMTLSQVIVLGVLALIAVGLVITVAWLFLGNALVFAPIPTQPPRPVLETATPLPTYTLWPTSPPKLPTPTFTATTYESLIPPDWKQYTFGKVELWIGPDFVSQSSEDSLIHVENVNTDEEGLVVVDLYNTPAAGADLDEFIRAFLTEIPAGMNFLEKRKFEIGTYPAYRVKVQAIVDTVSIMEAMYFIQDGDTIWIMGGISSYDNFNDWLPIFDQIAHTFRINP
jgi:hypothetical protein